MRYRILAQTYGGRWEYMCRVRTYEEVHNKVSKISPNDYYEYMVIQETDRDEIVEIGKFNKSKVKIKKL